MSRSIIHVHYLTYPELRSLLAAIGTGRLEPKLAQRYQLMVLVTFWHCLRVSEAIGIAGANIRDGYVSLDRLKRSEDCHQPYVDLRDDPELADLDEYAMLTELAATVKPKERLFEITRFGFYNLMQRAGKRAELPPHKRHPHCLKHTGVMAAIRDGVHYARKRAGHVSLSSTGHYLQLTDDKANRAFAKTARHLQTALEE